MDFQKINHYPGTFCIGRKDRLTRCLSRFRRRVGSSNCDFYPRTHLLPSGYKDWKEDFQNSKGIWIYKPGANARGIGIKVITKLEQIGKNKTGIVQAYLSSPFCIDGYKFDMRDQWLKCAESCITILPAGSFNKDGVQESPGGVKQSTLLASGILHCHSRTCGLHFRVQLLLHMLQIHHQKTKELLNLLDLNQVF